MINQSSPLRINQANPTAYIIKQQQIQQQQHKTNPQLGQSIVQGSF